MPIDLNSPSNPSSELTSNPPQEGTTPATAPPIPPTRPTPPETGRKGEGYNFGKTGECLLENGDDLVVDGLKLWAATYKKNVIGIVTSLGDLVKDVAGCIKEGFEPQDK